jgi:hypothetical protein
MKVLFKVHSLRVEFKFKLNFYKLNRSYGAKDIPRLGQKRQWQVGHYREFGRYIDAEENEEKCHARRILLLRKFAFSFLNA